MVERGHGVKVRVPSLNVALRLKACSLSTITMSDVEPNQQQQYDAFLAKTIGHYEQLVQNLEEKEKEFVAKAERMWGSEHVVDTDLQRFDHEDSIELLITSDQWECDEWLKVSHTGIAYILTMTYCATGKNVTGLKAVIKAPDGTELVKFSYRVVNPATLLCNINHDFDMHFWFKASETGGYVLCLTRDFSR